mmetsp:Transcript_75550/g.120157  ORF Transcript_75550/g.120157 Transcript_75550/m.120157 type:complete len:129 (-) Transcript_75550:27-413(-)
MAKCGGCGLSLAVFMLMITGICVSWYFLVCFIDPSSPILHSVIAFCCGAILAALCAFGSCCIIGFGSGGVRQGSLAASWQSSIGNVSSGSCFAVILSLVMLGLPYLLIAVLGGVLSIYALTEIDSCTK